MILIREIIFDKKVIEISENIMEFNEVFNYDCKIKISENVYFSHDFWDFNNKNTIDKPRYFYIYDFSNIDYRYKFYLKRMVLNLLLIKKLSASTVKPSYFAYCKSFITHLEKKHIYNSERITSKVVKEYFEKKECSERTKDAHRSAIMEILSEIEHNNEKISFQKIYDFLSKRDKKKKAIEIETGKTKIIPAEMFDKIVSFAINDLKNKNTTIKDKLAACMIIILAETGMRIGEFVRIEADKLREFKLDNVRKVYYLEFKTYKTIKCKESGFRWTETYLTENAKYAYEEMCRLSQNFREECNSNYAYLYRVRNSRKNFIKYDEDSARVHIYKFIIKHYDKFQFDNINYSKEKFNSITINQDHIKVFNSEFKDWLGKKIYIFTPHQFRVTVCTRLYRKNIPLEFIQKHMNHLTEDMTGHYIRMEELEEKKLQALKLIKDRVDENGQFLETDISKIKDEDLKKELESPELSQNYKAINKFLKKNKFKIIRDMEQVVDILIKSNTPITQLPEGYCARNALSNICERQEYISSINDYYDIGLHVPSIEYLDVTYEMFLEKTRIVEYNEKVAEKNKIYELEYKRELKALRRYINDRLLPEINLAKDKIRKNGIEDFIKTYPKSANIALKIDEIINKEVTKWII